MLELDKVYNEDCLYVYLDEENVTEELVSNVKSNINKSKEVRLW